MNFNISFRLFPFTFQPSTPLIKIVYFLSKMYKFLSCFPHFLWSTSPRFQNISAEGTKENEIIKYFARLVEDSIHEASSARF